MTAVTLLDRAAAQPVLDEDDLRAWGEQQRVFVSSLIAGYEEPRQAAAEAVRAIGAQPIMFEAFGGRDADPNKAYLDEVAASTIYVGLLGARYGVPLPSRYSATHEEYLHAEAHGLRISIWREDVDDREGPQQSFLDEVQVFNVTGSFTDPETLTEALERRLRAIAAEELSPWCRLGPALFRAREISGTSERAQVKTVIRDDGVAEALQELDSSWSSDAQFSYWGGVHDAGINELSARITSGASRELTLDLELSAPSKPTEVALGGTSWDELTATAIRSSWFGEGHDLGHSGFMVELTNPFTDLHALSPPDEALRPIARTLAYETLYRERGPGRLVQFQLGPEIKQARLLKLGWQPAKRYANEPRPAPVVAEGPIAFP